LVHGTRFEDARGGHKVQRRERASGRTRQGGDPAPESLPHPIHGKCILIAGRRDCQYWIARIGAQLAPALDDFPSTLPMQRPAHFMPDTILASQNFFDSQIGTLQIAT
jgi:hypothetical protein